MQSIKYWFESAMSYQISGDKENAIKLYRKVIDNDPNNDASMDNVSLLVDPTESLELLRRSLKIKRNDAKIESRIISILNGMKNDNFKYRGHFISDYPWVSRGDVTGGAEICNLVASLPFDGIFASDNLVTWNRNLSFLGDDAMMAAIEDCTHDLKTARGLMWRTAVVTWAARTGMRHPGDLVECGTLYGTTAKIIHQITKIEGTEKHLWLYDLFDWDAVYPKDSPSKMDLHSNIKNMFKESRNVNIIKGSVPESFHQGIPDRICFLHIDMNNADAEIGALKNLWSRLSPGCLCVLDDYGHVNFANQKKEEDEFFMNLGYCVLELPTGQGIVIK